jgi:hypothetical protein
MPYDARHERSSMNRIVQTIALVTCAGLLLGILLVLAGIGRNGVRIELAGDVNVTGMHDAISLSFSEPVPLVMEEPAHLITTGADGKAVPTTVSLLPCPECGASMLPVRWSPWSGEIEWACPVCNERITRPAESE